MLRAIVVAALVMLTCVGPLNAQSQPPPSTPTVIGDPQQEESTFRDEPAAPKEREPEVRPPAIETAPTPDAAPNTPQKHEKHEEESATDWWSRVPNLMLVIFTAILAGCTVLLTWIARRQNQMMRTIERAYVKMSHHSRREYPALNINLQAGTATVTINIRNFGRTPAEVTDVFLALAFDDLPPPGSYILPPGHQQTRVYLVTQDKFNHYVPFTGLDPDALMAVMEDEERKLWLYGYVDYRDRFGTRHRGGYMRRYERFDRTAAPDALGHLPERYNNLVFDPTPGFNYDRERERGEGNDWNEN